MPYQAHWNPPVKKRGREAEPGGVKRRARGKQPPQNPQDSVARAEPVASPTPPTPSSLAGALQDCSRSGSSCKNSTSSSSSSSSSSSASNDDENEPQPQKSQQLNRRRPLLADRLRMLATTRQHRCSLLMEQNAVNSRTPGFELSYK